MNLAELQNWLKKHKIDAYLVDHNNMFFGQDILPEENAILKLTGFSGSAGSLLVLQNKAILIVDGRYEIQSKLETDPKEVEIHCNPSASHFSTLVRLFDVQKKYKVIYNPWTLSHSDFVFYTKELPQITFIAEKEALLGSRLSNKPVKVFKHQVEYCGMDSDEKIALIINKMSEKKLDALLITEADNVSWLLNLRSDALPNTPTLRAYALLDKNAEIHLFADNIDYSGVESLSALKNALKKYKKQKIGIEPNAPQMVYDLLPSPQCAISANNIIDKIKAIKNPIELDGIKKAHIRDAVAIIEFLHWLDNNWQDKSELDIVAQLRTFREKQDLFYSDSFSTIAGFGRNGAIVHYQPQETTNLTFTEGSTLLLDSGAQYFDGTTDITRTIAIGTPTTEMTNDFTTVLKCHIELSSAYFTQDTDGKQLDSICRHHLWKNGKDYKHGTGHGVGCFLNVHEGPNLISKNARRNVYQPRMITSIEPGYYKENAYGIRIENLYYVDEIAKELENPMLKFEPLTYVPIDKRLIDKYLLEQGDIDWLNNYHQKVWELISPLVDGKVKAWLESACSPL